jgi:rhamnosyl/mannosyltransferase
MAAARLVVIPLTAGRLRGAGEASFLNAMWHGRPVICGDDVSAPEYIDNWSTGVVVPPGDPVSLRNAITTLWEDRQTAEALGRAGYLKVRSSYTHQAFWSRMGEIAYADKASFNLK